MRRIVLMGLFSGLSACGAIDGTGKSDAGLDPGVAMGAGEGAPIPATGDSGTANDAGGVVSDGGIMDDAGTKADGGSSADAGHDPVDVSPAALKSFVKSGAYLQWRAEPAKHPSAGPHGGSVRTFVNASLYTSMVAGNAVHPVGSIVVKELYGNGSTVIGHAVDVKDEKGTWVFYEGFTSNDYENPYYFTGTNNLCGNCHAGGTDYVLTSAAALQ